MSLDIPYNKNNKTKFSSVLAASCYYKAKSVFRDKFVLSDIFKLYGNVTKLMLDTD